MIFICFKPGCTVEKGILCHMCAPILQTTQKTLTGIGKQPFSDILRWEIVTNVCVLTVIPHWTSRALCWRVSLQVLQLLLNTAETLLLIILLNRYSSNAILQTSEEKWPLYMNLDTVTTKYLDSFVSLFHTKFTPCVLHTFFKESHIR